MYRLIFYVLLFNFISYPLSIQAKNSSDSQLKLQCSIHFNNFNGIEQASTGMKVSIKNVKNQEGGAVLVTQTKDYEFWVMSHSQQKLEGKSFINNFQVAIKDKKTGLFMHALSDSSYSATQKPSKARISLVDYHPNSLLEKGELFFECNSI